MVVGLAWTPGALAWTPGVLIMSILLSSRRPQSWAVPTAGRRPAPRQPPRFRSKTWRWRWRDPKQTQPNGVWVAVSRRGESVGVCMREREREWVWVWEREWVWVCEKESGCGWEGESVCVCVCERESVCVRERERVCVCVREREREITVFCLVVSKQTLFLLLRWWRCTSLWRTCLGARSTRTSFGSRRSMGRPCCCWRRTTWWPTWTSSWALPSRSAPASMLCVRRRSAVLRLPPRPPARQASCWAGRCRRSPRASYAGSEKVLVDLQGLLERSGMDGVTVRKSRVALRVTCFSGSVAVSWTRGCFDCCRFASNRCQERRFLGTACQWPSLWIISLLVSEWVLASHGRQWPV